jgi:hypothetical protein
LVLLDSGRSHQPVSSTCLDLSAPGRGIVDDQQAAIACLRPELKPCRVIHTQLVRHLGLCLDVLRSDDAGNLSQWWLVTGLDIVR